LADIIRKDSHRFSAMYQTVPVTCPNCNHRFASPVLTILDAHEGPEAKALFLAGQFNIAVCPQCGNAGLLNAPLVYHDAEKELLLTYVPSELGLPEFEQQRMIGDLTNRVISALPAEQRKGYLLRPRSFLRLEGMIEVILEADGITHEMLEAQRAKSALLDQLLRTADEDSRRVVVQENDGQIDSEFFQILTLNIELAQSEGQQEALQQLLGLRGQLLDWTTTGQEMASREEAIRELGVDVTREGLLEKLVAAALAGQQAKIETMVAVARPAIDYLFYQQLTGYIQEAEQAGNTDKADTLKALRASLLELTAEIDAEIKLATEQAAGLLQEILQSDDLEQAVLTNLSRIDDLFLHNLMLSLQAAEQEGRTEVVEKLEKIGDVLTKLIQESQPPEVQFISELLSAEYPDRTQALLAEHSEQVTPRLLEMMRLVGDSLSRSGRESVAQRLSEIREQAQAMVQ
jgi:CpXC protein